MTVGVIPEGAGGVVVGSASRFVMVFTDADSVRKYMPSIGPFAPLNVRRRRDVAAITRGGLFPSKWEW